jgi:hypothetical protein
MGDQWDEDSKAELNDAGRPVESINQIFKAVNVVTGYYRQNKTDINYFPVEGSDQATADILTETSKWALASSGADDDMSYAFGDCVRTGLGWLSPWMDYSKDPLNGDIRVGFEDKYHVMFEPYSKSPTLDDCDYIIRYAWPSKERLISLYPQYKKQIKSMKSGTSSKFSRQLPYQGIQDRGMRLNVVEKWEREWKDITLLIDPVSLDTYEWTKGRQELGNLFEQRPEMKAALAVVKGRVPRIKLITQIEGKAILHDGDPPAGFSKTMYPFIPIFAYYVPNFNDWKWKLQGVIRVMKDPQREYNKIRSVLMDAAMTVPNSGWIHEKGAVDDPQQLRKTGAGQLIEKNPGKELTQIDPAQIAPALTQLHEQHKADIRELGTNPDLMGIVGEGGSSAAAPGVSLQLRQKQGLLSLQNPFDGMSLAKKQLGLYLKEMIVGWPNAKIERIIGRKVPPQFDKYKRSGRYDCIIDEKTHSATYRLASFAELQSLVQHGVQIPPAVLREASNIPAETKQIWAQQDKQQSEQSLKQRQEETQLKLKEIEAINRGPITEKQMDNQGDLQLEKLKQEGDKQIKLMDIAGKKQVENIKQRSTQ